MAVAAAASSFMSSQSQAAQQKYQANVAEHEAQVADQNALAVRRQADVELQRGQIEQEKIDRERDALRRQYEAEAGRNRSLLASGNVDISSGSAFDSLMGNAVLFSGDLAANRYNRAVAGWEAGERSRRLLYQADLYANQGEASRTQSSWLKKTAGNLGTSLLTAGIDGLRAGASSYSMAGGKFA
jgi:hypothetical protein